MKVESNPEELRRLDAKHQFQLRSGEGGGGSREALTPSEGKDYPLGQVCPACPILGAPGVNTTEPRRSRRKAQHR